MSPNQATPGEVTSYDKVMEGRQADIAPRLAEAATRPTDPQVIEVMLTILKNVPWTADSSKPLWRHVFGAVAASKSARFVQEADVIRSGFTVRPLMKSYLENQFKKAIKGLPTTGAAAPARAAPAKKALAGAQDEGALLAAVYARPADDAPRQVYADFLMERGDPRGEFISLQLSGRDAKKEKALLKEHGKKWLGEIAPVVGAEFEFRRGFLSKAVARFRHEADARRFGALPAWSTVEELSWTGPYPRPLGQAPFIDYLGPTMVSLKKADQPHGPSLLKLKQPLATLEELTVDLPPMSVAALLASKNFPRLHTIELSGDVDENFFRNLKGIGAVKHLVAGVGSKRAVGTVAAAALQHGFETVTLNDQTFDRKSAPKVAAKTVAKATQALPELGMFNAVGTRADGAVVFVDDENIYVFDAELTSVLETWPIEELDRAQVTPDGTKVIGTSYRQLIGFDTMTGETLFDLTVKSIEDYYKSQHALSADGQRISVMGDVVIDLKTKKELPRPRGSAKAWFTDPDQQWWCGWGSKESQWTLQRLDTKAAFPLGERDVNEEFSRSHGVLHFRRDEGLTAFDLVSGQQLGHLKGSYSLTAYSSDGSMLALGNAAGTHLVDARTLKVKKTLKQKAAGAAFSPDDSSLLMTLAGKIARVQL